MRLRTPRLLVALALGLLLAPLAAGAQQAGKVPRVGLLWLGFPGPSPFYDAFLQGLRDLGYVEGQNFIMEQSWAQGKPERLPDLAAELVRLKVNVIVAPAWPVIRAAKQATRTIPIVMVIIHDPVGTGLVASLARPGGNLTGLSCFAPELSGKLLEVLKEAVPAVTRVALLSNPVNLSVFPEMETASRALGLQLRRVEVGEPNDLDRAFSSMAKERVGAVFVEGPGMFFFQRRHIAELAVKNRLPTMFEYREYVDAGGFISYGPSYTDLFRRAAAYVDKILKGANPGELPVERAARFELVINLKTAKALGLTIPQSVLIRADEVIQ